MTVATDRSPTPQSLFGVGRPVRDGTRVRMTMPISAPTPGTAMLGVLIDDLLGCAFYDRRGDHDGIVGAELSISFTRPTGWQGAVLGAEAHLAWLDDDGGHGMLRVVDGAGNEIATATMWGSFVDGVEQRRSVHAEPDSVPLTAPTAPPLDLLDGRLVRTEAGVTLTVPGRRAFANTMGMMHGGIQACGHDLAAGAAAPDMWTASLHVNFFRPVVLDGPVSFDATALRSGRRVSVVRTAARDHTGRVCSVATATLRRAAAPCPESAPGTSRHDPTW